MTTTDSLPRAVIQLDRYGLSRVALRVAGDWPVEGQIPLTLRLKQTFGLTEDRKHARVQLLCQAHSPTEVKDASFRLEVAMEGLFSVVEAQGDPEIADRVLHENTVAILFPYLRASISVITAMANIPPLVLPVVNVVEMLRQQREKPSKLPVSTKVPE